VVGPGETWITELPDGELRQLVSLSRGGAVADAEDEREAAAPAARRRR